MNIISRYLFQEFIKTSFGVFVVLFAMMMGNSLIKFIEKVADGDLPIAFMWPLFGLSVANFTVIFFGVSVFFGILLAFGRLYKDAEMSALIACGATPWQFIKPCLMIAVPTTLIAGFLTLYIVPNLNAKQSQILSVAKQTDVGSILMPGEFNYFGNFVLFNQGIQNVNKNKQFERVFIHQTLPNNERLVQLAQQGELHAQEKAYEFRLRDGALYRWNEDDSFISVDYKTARARLELPPIKTVRQSVEDLPTQALFKSKKLEHIAEWQWRISFPLATILLCLIAFPLSHTAPRKSAYSKLIYAVFIYFFYSSLLTYAKSLLLAGKISPVIGLWWAHVPIIVLMLVLFAVRYKWLKNWRSSHKLRQVV